MSLVDELLFESWAKEHPEEAKEILEERRKEIRESIKKRLDYVKELREQNKKRGKTS